MAQEYSEKLRETIEGWEEGVPVPSSRLEAWWEGSKMIDCFDHSDMSKFDVLEAFRGEAELFHANLTFSGKPMPPLHLARGESMKDYFSEWALGIIKKYRWESECLRGGTNPKKAVGIFIKKAHKLYAVQTRWALGLGEIRITQGRERLAEAEERLTEVWELVKEARESEQAAESEADGLREELEELVEWRESKETEEGFEVMELRQQKGELEKERKRLKQQVIDLKAIDGDSKKTIKSLAKENDRLSAQTQVLRVNLCKAERTLTEVEGVRDDHKLELENSISQADHNDEIDKTNAEKAIQIGELNKQLKAAKEKIRLTEAVRHKEKGSFRTKINRLEERVRELTERENIRNEPLSFGSRKREYSEDRDDTGNDRRASKRGRGGRDGDGTQGMRGFPSERSI